LQGIYAQLLSSSGASLRHAMTLVEMEVRALSILKHLKVRVIVIDEVHNLLAAARANSASSSSYFGI